MKPVKNPIERAVRPLKKDAMERARQEGEAEVLRVRNDLAKAGGDINKAAPYPSSWGSDALHGINYEIARMRYNRFHSLVQRDETKKSSYTSKGPYYVVIDEDKAKRYVKQRVEWAARDYEAFITKLVKKIGDTKKAKLHGNHVWEHSTLIVTLPTGEVQAWKTQQIVNYSKLGKPFNQWPTRQMKKVPDLRKAA